MVTDKSALQRYIQNIGQERLILVKSIYGNSMKRRQLSQTSGFDKDCNVLYTPSITLVDSQLARSLNDDNSLGYKLALMKVRLNEDFGMWQVAQQRRLQMKADLLEWKLETSEEVQMSLLEGSFVSALGTVNLDSNGQLVMSNLVAIITGGIYEAKKYLNLQINKQLVYTRGLFAVSAFSFAVALFCLYDVYKTGKLREEARQIMQAADEMPSAKAERTGTMCTYCWSKPSNIILVPCNHLCICEECFREAGLDRRGACPHCRRDVEGGKVVRLGYRADPQVAQGNDAQNA